MSNNDGKMSFDLNVSINEVMNQDSVREVTNQIKKQKEEIEQPIKINISDKDAKDRLKQLEKATRKLERDLGKAIQSNNYSEMSVLAENISENKIEMKQLQEIIDRQTKSMEKQTRSIKKQQKATQSLIKTQEQLRKAYSDSRKAYEVEFSDGKKMYFPTKDKAQKHVENVNSLSGDNTSRYKREVYLRNLSQQDRDSFEKIYYQPSTGYKPGSPFQLTGVDLDTYISIIEGLEDFQNQYNRLTKIKDKGGINATIRPNKNLLDQLDTILNKDKNIEENKRELLERILVHRTENLETLQNLLEIGKNDVFHNKKSTDAKMSEFYENPESESSSKFKKDIEGQTKIIEEQTKELNSNTEAIKTERKELLSYAEKPVKIFDLLNLKPNFLQDVFLYLSLTLEDIYKKQIDGEDMSFSIVHKNGASEYINGNEVYSTNEQGIISSKSLLDLSKQEFEQLLKNVVYMGVQGDGNNFDTQFGNLDEYAIKDSNLQHNSTQYLELYDSYVRKMYKDKYELDAYAKMSAKEIEAEQKAIEKYENSVLNGEQVNNYFEDIRDNVDKTSLSLSEFISLLKDLDFAQSQSLLNLINNLMNSKYQISDEVQNILYNMHLLDQNNKFIGKFTDQGFSNRGVVMSDQYAVIGRRPDYYSEMDDQDVYNFQFDSSDSYLDNLIAKMEIAKQNGIGLSRILKVIKSESEFSDGTLYEIQELAPGNPAHIMGSSKTLENFIIENQRLISATDDQIIKLMNDVVELNSMGFQFDFGTGNILYDTQKGFTLIDLSLREIDQKIPKTEDLIRRLFDAITGLSDNDYRFLDTIDSFNIEENPKWVEQISSVFNRFYDALSNSKYKDFLEEGSRKFYDYKEKYNQTLNQLNNKKQMPKLQEFINSLYKKYGENDFSLLFDDIITSMTLTEETAAELYSKLEKREQEYLDSHTRNVHAYIEQQKYMREQQQLLFEHQDDKEFMEQYFSISQKIGEGFLSSGEGTKELNNFVVSRNSNSDDILDSPSELELVKDLVNKLPSLPLKQEEQIYMSEEWHNFLQSLNIAEDKITTLSNAFVELIRSSVLATDESQSENLTERLFDLLANNLLNEARDVNILDDIYKSFLNYIKNVKIYYNDTIKAAYGDDWKGFYSKHKNNLRATKTPLVSGADQFVENASNSGFSSFFDDVISGSDIDQFKKIFDVIDYVKSLPKDSKGNFIEYTSYDKHKKDELSEQLSLIYIQIAGKVYNALHGIETNTQTTAKKIQETTENNDNKSKSKNNLSQEMNFLGNGLDENKSKDKDKKKNKVEKNPDPIFRIPTDESLRLLREAQNDRKDLVDLSSVLDINDLQGTLKDLIPDIYGEDYQLDRVHLSENIATLVISNEKLGKRIIQTYQHRDNTNEDTGVENIDFFKLADDLVVDLKQARRIEAKDSKQALVDENWLNNKFNQLVNQRINAEASSKKVDLDTKLYAPEATSFNDNTEHTIGDLVDSIRSSIETGLTSGLSTEIKNTIEQDLGALKNELKVAYAASHVSTEMTPTAFKEVVSIFESNMKQLVANAKKNGTYDQLIGKFEALDSQRKGLTEANQVAGYVDAERSLKKEIAAVNAEQDLQKSKFREILDLTNRLERATDTWQQQYKDGRSTKVQDDEIVYYNQRLSQLKQEVQLTEDQQIQLDNIHKEHAQKRGNIELNEQQKQVDSVLKMQEQMQTAILELQTKGMQLSKYQDLPEYDQVFKRLTDLGTTYKNFMESSTTEGKTKYFNEYQENYRILKAEMQNLSEIQKMNNQETKAETASIQNYYSTILNLIKEIASYDSKIQNLQLKGKPEFLPFIKVLETQKQQLIENARSVISEMQNSIGTSGLEGENPVQLPLTNILQNIDDKNSLQNFLRDAGVQAVLTSKQIDDLTNALLKAQNATDEYGAKLQELTTHRMDLVQSLNDIFKKNDLNKNNKYVSGTNNIGEQLDSLIKNNQGKAVNEWSSEDITKYQFLIEELEKYKTVLESATDKERAFFTGKEQFTKTTNFKTFNEKEFESADKYNEIQQKLIESARQFAKQSGDSDAIITKFVTDANGISKLDFSVFDKGTKSLRNFTMASGQFLNGIYLSEQSTSGFLDNIKKGTAQIQNIQNVLNKVQLSDTISFDQPIVHDLLNLQKQLGDEISKGKGADQTVLSKLISDAKIASSELDKLYKKHLQLKDSNVVKQVDFNQDIYKQATAMMYNYASVTDSTITQIGKFNQANNTMKFTMVDTSGTIKDVQISLDKLGGSLALQERTIKSYSSKWEMIKDQFGRTARQLTGAIIGYNVFYKIISEFRKGYGYVKQIDKAITELKKVTDETELSYKNFLNTTSKTASVIGSTVSDFVEATANFARLGYTMEESSDMAKSAIVYKNVADGLNSIDEATGSIISTMKAFGIESSDTMLIVDRFNEVGNKFAITSAGIGDALKRSASALYSAGNTIDESIGLITAANSVVQNPEQVGTALKTLSLRLRGAKTELEDANLETEGMVETTSQLQKKLLGLSHGKVDILLNPDTFKNTTQILREMSSAWGNMTDMERAAALELMGGKRQANILSSIITNFDTVENVIKTSSESSGSALKENEKYLDSIQGKIDILKNSQQTMWNNALNSEFMKFLLDILNTLTKIIDKFGLFNTLFAAGIAKTTFSSKNLFGNLLMSTESGMKFNTSSLFGKMFNHKDTDNYTDSLKVLGTSTVQAVDGVRTLSLVTNQQGMSAKQNSSANTVLSNTERMVGNSAAAASIGVRLLNSALTMGISLAVGFALDGIMNGISKLIHHAEILKEEVNDITKTYETAKNEFSENLNKLSISSDDKIYKNLTNEFEHLTRGVDKNGKNISLTADEYERYKKICETIVGINPKLKIGYDNVAEAIGNNANELSNLIENQKREMRYNAEEYTTDENVSKIFNDKLNDFNKIQDKIKHLSITGTDGTYSLEQLLYNEFFKHDIGNLQDAEARSREEIKYILDKLDLSENYNEIVSKYENDWHNIGTDGYQKFLIDYSDEIAKYADVFDNDALSNWAVNWKSSKRDLKYIKDSMISTFLEIPASMNEYDQLSSSNKSFISEWIKNSELFKIDENTTSDMMLDAKIKIRDFISNLSTFVFTRNGKPDIKATDIIDQIVNLDSSTVNWEQYKNELNDLIRMLWSAIGADENTYGFKNEQDLTLYFGLDIEKRTEQENEMIKKYSKIKKISEDDATEYFNSLPPITIQRMLSLDWNLITNENELDTAINGISMSDTISVLPFDELISKIDNIDSVIEKTKQIFIDNTIVTQEYKDSLLDLGLTEEELSQYFDENNPLLVKNAKGLNELVSSTKNVEKNNIRLAKSQARLKYYQLYKEMRKLGPERKNEINDIYSEMTALQKVISKYNLLESKLLGVTNAYDSLDEAKQFDDDNDYLSKTSDMFSVLLDGFNTGKVGSESFKAALLGMVPDSVLDKTKSEVEQLDNAFEYLQKISKFFDVEFNEDGSISKIDITMNNIKDIFEYLKDQEVLTGTFENFDLSENIHTLDQFAKEANITKEFAFAILQSFENFDLSYLGGDSTTLLDKLVPTSKDIDNFAKKMQESFPTTTIDLSVRPKISYEKMKEKGYDIGESSYATVYSSSVDSRDFGITKDDGSGYEILLTPILPNNEVLSEEELQNYVESKLNSGIELEDIDVVLGVYDNQNEANEAANKLHDMQETFDEMNKNYNLEFDVSSVLQNLAQLDYQLANNMITPEEYSEKIINLNSKLKELGNDAYEEVKSYSTINEEIKEQKDLIDGYVKDINVMKSSGQLTNEGIISSPSYERLLEASGKLDELLLKKDTLKEPTDMIIRFAIDQQLEPKQEELKKLFGDKVDFDENGKMILRLTFETPNTEQLQAIRDYEDLWNKQHEIDISANSESAQVDVKNLEISAKNALDALNNIDGKNIEVTVTGLSQVERLAALLKGIKNRSSISFDAKNSSKSNTNNRKANAQGSDGIDYNQTSLVGELGPEMLVRDGEWHLVGQDGAEFTDVKRGDIIFNHKQTKDLLSSGKISGRGKAFAEGNAFVGGVETYDHQFGNVSNSLKNVGDNISDAADKFEEVFDWIAIRLEEIDEELSLVASEIENAVGYSNKNKLVDFAIDLNNIKLTNLESGLQEYIQYADELLTKIPENLQSAAKNGSIAIQEFAGEEDEAVVSAINNYRDWASKVADVKQQIVDLEQEISSLSKQKFDNVSEEFDNKITLVDQASDKLNSQLDLIEKQGNIASEDYYNQLLKNSETKQNLLEQEKQKLQEVLDTEVKLGHIKINSAEWNEMVQQLYTLDDTLIQVNSEIEDFQNAINDIHWNNFDELISRFEYLESETKNLIDVMNFKDVVSENGDWTNEGITSLGLLSQQMEIAEYKAKKFADEIKYLEQNKSKYSDSEYHAKMQELKESQYDSIKSYEDAKKAIVDLNKTRVDSIKNGINKEIEAYSKLISKKKEALSSEKDLYDFQKNVKEQEDNISSIERKLLALSNDNSLSALAKRRQLEEELNEAKSKLDDTYYDRSIEQQQESLDKEQEDFEETKNSEIETWEKYLDNVEKVVADSLLTVQNNSNVVLETLKVKSEEYGISLSNAIVQPWRDGLNAIGSYKDAFGDYSSSTLLELDQIKGSWQQIIDKMLESSKLNIEEQKTINDNYISAKPNNSSEQTSTSNNSKPFMPSEEVSNASNSSELKKYSSVTVKKDAKYFSSHSGNKRMSSFVPGGTFTVYETDGEQVLIGLNGQYTGWINKKDVEGFAKGTLSTDKSQLAFIDELGEELVMHAGNNGKLSFLSKGSSVIPHDISENLIKLGKLDPKEILNRAAPKTGDHISSVNNIELNMDIAEVVHIDTVTQETLPDLTNTIEKAMDGYMKKVNNSLRKYTR